MSGENKTLVEQLDELRDQLDAIGKIYQTVSVTADDARDIATEGLTNIDEAEKVLDKTYEQLTVSETSQSLFLTAEPYLNFTRIRLQDCPRACSFLQIYIVVENIIKARREFSQNR